MPNYITLRAQISSFWPFPDGVCWSLAPSPQTGSIFRAARQVHMCILTLREGSGSKSASVLMKTRFLVLSLRVAELERALAYAGLAVPWCLSFLSAAFCCCLYVKWSISLKPVSGVTTVKRSGFEGPIEQGGEGRRSCCRGVPYTLVEIITFIANSS